MTIFFSCADNKYDDNIIIQADFNKGLSFFNEAKYLKAKELGKEFFDEIENISRGWFW